MGRGIRNTTHLCLCTNGQIDFCRNVHVEPQLYPDCWANLQYVGNLLQYKAMIALHTIGDSTYVYDRKEFMLDPSVVVFFIRQQYTQWLVHLACGGTLLLTSSIMALAWRTAVASLITFPILYIVV